ncbi:Serine/threonine-protein phosphatase PP1 isozyme 8 [Tritrichomonas foetus]|uniref:Serine/threonine-protein phosphatase n=1 Tax=Tritrichomonas foetus TaxID=1144522 RepID=A0A1J4K7N4_9EUKA|nr:Serine/threonine-protein phosphatase PP1 isozyme 8 [Tritrichomonas foetus]|eukprot:OHT07391.1 Serine/threonine-protein phosphatase PP1 isozyme 8 [Tritrichomonas foetus]
MGTSNQTYHYKTADAQWLCRTVKPILQSEPTVLDLTGPINVVGDVHGQFTDLVRCLQIGGLPPFSKWLFLGDYVDRGPNSVEVMCLLFALKIRYPTQIFLIRGNHETSEMTEVFGFAQECSRKLTVQTWSLFCDTFEYLPMAAIVNSKYFCIHGGISPKLEKVQQIRNIKRPLTIPPTGMITDLLWSDPNPNISEYGDSERGETCTYGLAPIKRFLQNNNLKFLIRGHQVAENGYDFPFLPEKCTVTVFTASNYSPDLNNKAAFMKIDQAGKYEIKVMTPLKESPPINQLPIVPKPRSRASNGRRATLPSPAERKRRSSSQAVNAPVVPQPNPSPNSSNSNFGSNSVPGNISKSNSSVGSCPPKGPSLSASLGAPLSTFAPPAPTPRRRSSNVGNIARNSLGGRGTRISLM